MEKKLHFKSSLTLEEIEHNFKDVDIFSGIMDGLQEAHSHTVLTPKNQDNKYYQLTLDDFSAPAFTNLGKPYYGTLSEIRAFLSALEEFVGEDSGHSSLLDAFRAYEAGHTNAIHSVAFREIPLLVPAKLCHLEQVERNNYAWDHLNIWECTYRMRCDNVASVHYWFECNGKYLRAVKVRFTNLQYEGATKRWKPIKGPFWGFPCAVAGEPPNLFTALAAPEKWFGGEKELHQDWEAFKANPDPTYTEVCNDIFGDG